MPIRIYALAKELQIDSKELVDICTKAGITGKGSALASLDDDEVTKVKAFMAAGAKPPPARSNAPAAPIRPTGPAAPIRPVPPTIPSRPAPPPEPRPAPPIPVVSAGPTATPSEAPPEVHPSPPPAVAPASAEPESPGFDRRDYIRPGGSGKIRVLGGKPKPSRPGDQQEKPRQPPKPRVPVIHVAQLPDVKQPTPPPKPDEPAPQKPEIRLPHDAIASAKAGARPPLEHLTAKADKKKKAVPPVKTAAAEGETESAARPLKGRAKKERGREEVDTALAGLATSRADRQKSRRTRQHERVGSDRDRDDSGPGRNYRRRPEARRRTSSATIPRKGKVSIALPVTVRTFSEATGVGAGQVLSTLMKNNVMANINAQIDPDIIELLAAELGLEVEFKQQESLEDAVISKIRDREDSDEDLAPRAPIVTFLGHVDHGKTSLLDYLIGTKIVAGEAGGITQHIRAYQVATPDGRAVSFVDTPGHEAFTEMRARGANVTDVAVLVIAADDGIMPQTEEAISHAQAAGVPIVVALNKMDLPGANPSRVLSQLTEHNLTPSEWGGEVEVVRTSAISGQGMDELLDTLLTIAELHEYRANPSRPAYGVCLEAEQQGARGVMAKLIVQNGTLNVGDIIVCGTAYGRVKALYDTLRPTQRIKSAGPSMPVNVSGFDSAPEAGESFYVLEDIAQAREIAANRALESRAANLSGSSTKVSFEKFQELLRDGRIGATPQVSTLNLIVRADVRGSIEAIMKELNKLEHPEVQIRVLLKGVGGITVGDVHLADASDAVIVGFNVTPDEAARTLAEERKVEIRRYDIIYKLTDDLKAMLEGKLRPEERVVELGRAIVKQVFPISRVGTVAGCYVAQGVIERNCRIRVFRDGRSIGDYALDSLRREKDDIREVPRGMECGIKLAGFNDVKKDDILEAYKIEEVARTL